MAVKKNAMQRIILILIVFTFTYCVNHEKSITDNHVVKITLEYIDFDIETPFDIKCKDFEKSFPQFQTEVIEDTFRINQILKSLSILKIAGKEYYQHVDTRMKLELKYSNDSVETICMDRFIVNRNNQVLQNSDSFIYFLTGKK
jgi:hypothetical protein